MTIQQLLRRYRGARRKTVGKRDWWVGHVSQAAAAKATGIGVRNWQNWESGRFIPSPLACEEIRRRLKS